MNTINGDKNLLGYHEIFDGYGFYIDKVPQNILDNLKIDIDKIQNNFSSEEKVNDRLIGEIKHEYKLSVNDVTKSYIKELYDKIEGASGYKEKTYPNATNLDISSLWVNYMRKHEYNPMHEHSGVYSFVIWYQVPFYIEDERDNFSSKNLNKHETFHGDFSFVLPFIDNNNVTVREIQLCVDKNREGLCIIFPSNLNHKVNPFYSTDEYRITVAGNLLLHPEDVEG